MLARFVAFLAKKLGRRPAADPAEDEAWGDYPTPVIPPMLVRA